MLQWVPTRRFLFLRLWVSNHLHIHSMSRYTFSCQRCRLRWKNSLMKSQGFLPYHSPWIRV